MFLTNVLGAMMFIPPPTTGLIYNDFGRVLLGSRKLFFLAKLLRRRKRLSFLASRPSKASSLSSSELELSNAFARCGKK